MLTLPICKKALEGSRHELSKIHRSTFIRHLVRNLLAQLITDTEANIEKYKIKSLQDVQRTREIVVMFNADFYTEFKALKSFLMKHYYGSPEVKKYTTAGQEKIAQAFDRLVAEPELMPADFLPEQVVHTRVCDYIAGMTDHFLEDFLD